MSHKTSWGKAITFSWEYESSSIEIRDHYHPKLVDEAQWDAMDTATQRKVDSYLRRQTGPPSDIDLGPAVAAWAALGRNRKVQDYETWVKSAGALEHWPDHLRQEGSGAKWEIAHRSYEENLDDALEQVDEVLEVFSLRAG